MCLSQSVSSIITTNTHNLKILVEHPHSSGTTVMYILPPSTLARDCRPRFRNSSNFPPCILALPQVRLYLMQQTMLWTPKGFAQACSRIDHFLFHSICYFSICWLPSAVVIWTRIIIIATIYWLLIIRQLLVQGFIFFHSFNPQKRLIWQMRNLRHLNFCNTLSVSLSLA